MSNGQAPKSAPQKSLQRPKGTQDILPENLGQWQFVENLAQTLFQRAGYREIRTPVFEHTELFERGVGTETDIVNKEMYTFERSERLLTLRPEGTAGVVRAYIENGLSRQPKPVKLWYGGPMFRYERPQAGRQRQFHQIGMEVFGLDSPTVDAEVILLALEFFRKAGLQELSLDINNIGCPDCRGEFRDGLKTVLKPHLATLCETCQTRYETNPFRMLDCKVEADQAVYGGPDVLAFLEIEHTCEACQAHFNRLKEILDGCHVTYRRNPRLVRGLDYYTRTVFEVTSTNLGAQNAVCGGGRYDGLVEMLGGPPTPGVGWALGVERLLSLIPARESGALDYYLVTDRFHDHAFRLAAQLREAGFSAEVDLSGKGFGKQFEQADKRGARQVVILGESEVAAGNITLKNLETRSQETLAQQDFLGNL